MRGTVPLVVSCRWLKPTDRNRTLSFTAIVMGLAIWATMGPPKTHSKPVAKLQFCARNTWKSRSASHSESLPCVSSAERGMGLADSSPCGAAAMAMLMMKERRSAFRTIEGWARSVVLEAGAIHECEEHGWATDRADPHARERALLIARQDPPPGVSPDEAVAAVRDVLDTIGDTCPECPPDRF